MIWCIVSITNTYHIIIRRSHRGGSIKIRETEKYTLEYFIIEDNTNALQRTTVLLLKLMDGATLADISILTINNET